MPTSTAKAIDREHDPCLSCLPGVLFARSHGERQPCVVTPGDAA
jgi:hypothetical protein